MWTMVTRQNASDTVKTYYVEWFAAEILAWNNICLVALETTCTTCISEVGSLCIGSCVLQCWSPTSNLKCIIGSVWGSQRRYIQTWDATCLYAKDDKLGPCSQLLASCSYCSIKCSGHGVCWIRLMWCSVYILDHSGEVDVANVENSSIFIGEHLPCLCSVETTSCQEDHSVPHSHQNSGTYEVCAKISCIQEFFQSTPDLWIMNCHTTRGDYFWKDMLASAQLITSNHWGAWSASASKGH